MDAPIIEGRDGGWPNQETACQQGSPGALFSDEEGAPPDFAMVYAFTGSIFDPKCASIAHEDIVAQMHTNDRRAVIQLIRTLAYNLSSPDILHQFQVSSRTFCLSI